MSVFHMKPGSAGRVRLRSRDPSALPVVERGFLRDPATSTSSSRGSSSRASWPRSRRSHGCSDRRSRRGRSSFQRTSGGAIRNYFHPAGTCGIGRVVDDRGRVLGIDGLVVADASVMPTIPRANTNLTTVAIAERLAETI